MSPFPRYLFFLLTLFFPIAIWGNVQTSMQDSTLSPDLPPFKKTFLGIDILERKGFFLLKGKRVGLLTNPAGVNRNGVSTITILKKAQGVNLVALFGPEHGIYGDEKANVPIEDRTDTRTGLPVYSLYGKYRKPTSEMLKGLDIMVIDLQDLGVRSYTYVSCMRKVMEACFEENVHVVVLDRPNPLGGYKVGGPPMEKKWRSYVGAFPVPYVHGLTIGELALMAKKEKGWLDIDPEVRRSGRLSVIKMGHWSRNMLWPDTGLEWVPTSPAIPSIPAALGYAMTGLGAQLGGFRHGYGTPYPFRMLTFPGISLDRMEKALRAKKMAGLDYRQLSYDRPDGSKAQGLYVLLKDWDQLHPTELSFHMMQLACQWNNTNPFMEASFSQETLFNKHVGSTLWWNAIRRDGTNIDVKRFIHQWQREARDFQTFSRKYWLY